MTFSVQGVGHWNGHAGAPAGVVPVLWCCCSVPLVCLCHRLDFIRLVAECEDESVPFNNLRRFGFSLPSRIKQGGSSGRGSEAAAGFGEVLQLRGPAERNVGSATSHPVRWDSSASLFQASGVGYNMVTRNNTCAPPPSRLLHKDHVWSRSRSCAGASAAVLGCRGSVLQLLCSLQRGSFPGAPLEVGQRWGSLFVEVPSDSAVVFGRKGQLTGHF